MPLAVKYYNTTEFKKIYIRGAGRTPKDTTIGGVFIMICE